MTRYDDVLAVLKDHDTFSSAGALKSSPEPFPAALPHVFVGLKVAISLAVIGAVIGEFVGADAGLGHVIIASGSNVDTSLAFAAMVLLALMSIVLFYALVALERLLVPWAARGDGSA